MLHLMEPVSPDAPTFPPDLRDRYANPRLLGTGSFGTVFRVRDEKLERDVAIKLLNADVRDPQFKARFIREARVTSQLSHPGIVQVYDFGTTANDTAYIVYEFVEGESLEKRIGRAQPSSEEVIAWGITLADALSPPTPRRLYIET